MSSVVSDDTGCSAHLKAAGDSAVVNISSIGAWRSNGSSLAYTSSKGPEYHDNWAPECLLQNSG